MPVRRAQRGYLQTMRCAVQAAQLWQALVEPPAVKLWLAHDVELEPRPGGRYAYNSRLFGSRQARINDFEPCRRLRLIYEPNAQWPPAGQAVIVEDFLLDVRQNGTAAPQSQLRVLGSGVPTGPEWDLVHRRLQAGWAIAFSHLQRSLESGELERLTP